MLQIKVGQLELSNSRQKADWERSRFSSQAVHLMQPLFRFNGSIILLPPLMEDKTEKNTEHEMDR